MHAVCRVAFFGSILSILAIISDCELTAAPGGLERSIPTVRPLFQDGSYFEMSWAYVSPELTGRGGLLDPTRSGTGDLLESYDVWNFALKADLNCWNSLAVVLDQPWGVNTLYPTLATSGYSGTEADLQSNALSLILTQKLNQHFTFYGGVKAQTVEATVAVPFGAGIGLAGPYQATAHRDEGIGFLTGVAYEIEDIKLRIAATYHSQIETNHASTEVVGGVTTLTSTEMTTPQSLMLEFQSGIAPKTLAFGSIRWVDWSSFSLSPPIFANGVGQPLVQYTEDWVTYTIGVGRKFNDVFSLAVQLGYEPSTGQQLTSLGPIDGRFSFGIAPAITWGNTKTVVGVDFIELGEAENFAATQFEDGSAIAVGVRMSRNF